MTRRTLAWLALNHLPGAGAVTLRRLASRCGSPEAALEAPVHELVALGSLTLDQARAVERLVSDLAHFEQLGRSLDAAGTRLLTLEDDDYPPHLRLLRDAPPLLYVRGSLLPRDADAVAVVGTRTPSPQGAATAAEVAESLAARGITVVSGLALGVDGAAHRGALAAGRSIAVLGSGIDRVTPAKHQGLAAQIARCGALLSELPPGTRATRETLLARNRIQAGLTKVVIVVQCRDRGGSFATARRALRAGRPVLAIRWEEPEFAGGVERLEKTGARVVSQVEAVATAADAASAPLPCPAQPEMALGNAPDADYAW
jgi:DNA processing protein